jgi:hypothetical protein
MTAKPNCFILLRQDACRAFSLAFENTGNKIAANIAIMAMTTSNSIRVKPLLVFFNCFSP